MLERLTKQKLVVIGNGMAGIRTGTVGVPARQLGLCP